MRSSIIDPLVHGKVFTTRTEGFGSHKELALFISNGFELKKKKKRNPEGHSNLKRSFR